MDCTGPSAVPAGFVKATGRYGALGLHRVPHSGRRVPWRVAGAREPVTAAPLCPGPRLRAAADLTGAAATPGGMGGEAGSAAAVGFEGRVKNLGLVFEDQHKGSYSSGETVAGHVLLEAAEPVALCALRLEAHGRATAAWGPGAGAAAPATRAEVEYLNVRLSLREPPPGERGRRLRRPRRTAETQGWASGEGARGMPTSEGGGAGLRGGVRPRGGPCISLVAGDGRVTIPAACTSLPWGDTVRWVHTSTWRRPLAPLGTTTTSIPGPSRLAQAVSRCHGNR